jgi:hypothetical protein
MAAVTDPSVRLFFCEGKLDSLLLNRMVPLSKGEIRSTGGKRSMRAFIRGHLAGYSPERQPECVGFRDRDFDIEPPERQELIRLRGETPIWLTFRACIESYFVDAELVHDYWTASAGSPNWGHGNPPSADEIREKVIESARELAEYQAIRWALAKLKPCSRWPEIETTWTGESGRLPASLTFGDCLNQASRLVREFVAAVSQINAAKLEEEHMSIGAVFPNQIFIQRSCLLFGSAARIY